MFLSHLRRRRRRSNLEFCCSLLSFLFLVFFKMYMYSVPLSTTGRYGTVEDE